jgi:hypothetical protein
MNSYQGFDQLFLVRLENQASIKSVAVPDYVANTFDWYTAWETSILTFSLTMIPRLTPFLIMKPIASNRWRKNEQETTLRWGYSVNTDDVAFFMNADSVGVHLSVGTNVYHVSVGCLE